MKRRPLTITIDEAGEALGISRGSAYKAARMGELPVIRIGKRLLVVRDRFEEMLDDPVRKNVEHGRLSR
jgi:excisionase family DNA binding protein